MFVLSLFSLFYTTQDFLPGNGAIYRGRVFPLHYLIKIISYERTQRLKMTLDLKWMKGNNHHREILKF